MKKSIKNFEDKKVTNLKAIKGGGFGSGTKRSTTKASTRTELQ